MNIELFYDLLFNQLPFQIGNHLRKILIDIFSFTIFIGSQQPTFQKCIGQIKLTYCLFYRSTCINRKFIIAFRNQLMRYHFTKFSKIFLFCFYSIFTVYHTASTNSSTAAPQIT